MWYLFHGNDEFSAREALAALRAEGDFGYNQDTFKGAEVALTTLLATCDTYPFLSDQRLVVLEGLPEKPRGRKSAAGAGAAPADQETTDPKAAAEGQPATPPSPPKKKGGASKKSGAAGTDPKAFVAGLADYLPSLP